MIPKLFSDKFLERAVELGLTIPQLLGFNRSKLMYYPFITGKGFQDIRNVFKQTKEEDEELIDYYSEFIDEEINSLGVDFLTIMQKAKVIAELVNDRISYKGDKVNYSKSEYWARPIEVHRKKFDDCDGYSVLITYLLRLFGAKEWEVFTAAGNVEYPTGKIIGHAYTIVFNKNSLMTYPLEGSFYPRNALNNFGKITLQNNKRYKVPWFITNDKISYSKIPWLKFIR